ncbi:hypothetical protein BDN67DRAFT_638366 [Paxillus ammoniavirescens]|nr:hypothetical protein BDN67DRAFT_638366 [Paxillus ammoniavirescens]
MCICESHSPPPFVSTLLSVCFALGLYSDGGDAREDLYHNVVEDVGGELGLPSSHFLGITSCIS